MLKTVREVVFFCFIVLISALCGVIFGDGRWRERGTGGEGSETAVCWLGT